MKLPANYAPLIDLKRFFELLDYTKESDNGVVFHPFHISCCRVMMMSEMEDILKRLKARANMTLTEWNQLLGELDVA